jgi:hypothetical protein
MEKLKTYLFSYEHDGITWTVEVPATSPEDARARLQKYPDAKYEGLPVFKLPALFDRFVSLYFWLRDVRLSSLAEKIRNIPGVPLPSPRRPSPSTPESIEEAVIRSLRR